MTQAEWEAFINSKEQAMRAATAAALLEEQKRAAMVNIERIKTEELARQERLLSGMGIDLSSATDEKISTTTPSLPPSAAATTPTTNISHQEDDENEPLALASTKKSPMLPPALNTSPLRTKQHLAVAGADIRSELNIQSPMDPIVSLKHEAPSPVIRQEFDIQSPIVSSVAGAAQPALPPQQKSGIVIPLSKLRNDSNEDRDLPPLTPVIRSEFNIQSPLPDQDIPFIRMDNAVTLKQDFLRMMEEEEKRSREMTGIAEAPSGDLPSEVMGKYAPVVDAGFVRHRRSKLPNSHHSTSNNGMDDLGCQCVIL